MLYSNRHQGSGARKSKVENPRHRAVNLRGTLSLALLNRIHLQRSFNKHFMILAGSCIVLTVLFFVFPTRALAHTATGKPAFQVNAGFETHYRDGNWVPVEV